MTEVERAYFDGWRYLRLPPSEIDRMTHRELVILLRAATEAQYDEYEGMAHAALMQRQAYHAQRLKMTDLFKRPLDVTREKDRQKELLRKKAEIEDFVTRLDFSVFDEE